ncbi:MAG: DUF1893 domain-containing protein [Candidatus Nealsonbacteria bacterium]|nr:DUF1893 domain-containing protein [Candidatus Nealsonbacteria bacterium]
MCSKIKREEFEKFLNGSFGLEIYLKKKLIFRSKKSGVAGLLDFIRENGNHRKGLVVFDKIVGRGAALLCVYIGTEEIFGKLGSSPAAEVLNSHKIRFHFQETVASILNKNQTDICPIEKLSFKKTPEEFYKSLP